ncbi:2-isopropylmalate synthase [candidate division KSB1 bacterium]|nr:2-isopropylmalate synthase [candidate division KSB1 bacterium]NIR71314.1 2-isopropylmalate synthase [candidate division KSB1 bacterium]NIS24824.1 2-isopropylmalate synthase [candidate division KSB1 bacterium]NIT71743.1 2-isopropylmalate synthase [candidate division KSB1 bacterium]NIU25459.1 2-isopropylmalate synthase [candidate division KSB1 bacterium]
MQNPKESDLIYDWNTHKKGGSSFKSTVEFDDETLRDGLQGPSVTDPSIEDKIEILHLMDSLGIHTAALGLPGAGPRAQADVMRLAQEIADHNLNIKANCAARTVEADIIPIIEISDEVGIPIEACTFIGSSPIRQYAEGWDIDFLLRQTENAVEFAVKRGLPVMYVTEDTVRAHPDDIRKLYTTAINFGAQRVCVCDTVGHIIPAGVKNLVSYVREVVESTGEDVGIDWHGHRDRGFDVANTFAAIEAGATRVHGCALGVGERVGNTPMDLILANCKLLGWIDHDLSDLKVYCQKVSETCNFPIPKNYPIIGEDAYRTGTGVHAAAIIKAERKGAKWLADRVYSGVPAEWFGGEQKIEIGPMSGESNIVYWLKKRNLEPKKEWVTAIFNKAKSSHRLLKDEEIYEIINSVS